MLSACYFVRAMILMQRVAGSMHCKYRRCSGRRIDRVNVVIFMGKDKKS